MLHPQNGDRIVAMVSVTSLHPVLALAAKSDRRAMNTRPCSPRAVVSCGRRLFWLRWRPAWRWTAGCCVVGVPGKRRYHHCLAIAPTTAATTSKKGKRSPYSITERCVPQLIPVLDSQPAGDVSHKPGGRLPLLSARPQLPSQPLRGLLISLLGEERHDGCEQFA